MIIIFQYTYIQFICVTIILSYKGCRGDLAFMDERDLLSRQEPAPQAPVPQAPASPPGSASSVDEVKGVVIADELVTSPIRSTGIGLLDINLEGGLPAGSVIYFSAGAGSMSEVFLYQFSSSRKTYYFTTSRRPRYIAQNITDTSFDVSNIVFIDIYSQYYLDKFGEMIDNVGNEFVDKEIIDFMEYQLKNILSKKGEEFNIIIDTFSFFLGLNVNFGKILRLVNLIYEITKDTQSLSYLYVIKDAHDDRVENEIMNLCDTVFNVELERVGERMANKLSITKIRGRIAPADMLKFKVMHGVQIDTSRDIA